MSTCWTTAKILLGFSLPIRIAGLGVFAVWAFDCLIREFKMGIACENFTRIPKPEYFTLAWQVIVIMTTIISGCLIYIFGSCEKQPSNKSCKRAIELGFALILVLIYDFMTIYGVDKQETGRTALYVSFMLEHFFSVILVLALEYFPNTAAKTCAFRAISFVSFIEYFGVAALGAITAGHQLVSIPVCTNNQQKAGEPCHDAMAVIMVFLLSVLVWLRCQLGDFFLGKLCERDVDDSPSKTTETGSDDSPSEATHTSRLVDQVYSSRGGKYFSMA